MPFANKYRFTMRFPTGNSRLGAFTVESCDVRHDERGDGTIVYPFSIVLAGTGGKQEAKKAVRRELDQVHTTFSGYGNPYQLHLGQIDVESLGNRRYLVTGRGIGVRIHLKRELQRFVAYTKLHGLAASDTTVDSYLDAYKRDITRRNPEIEY